MDLIRRGTDLLDAIQAGIRCAADVPKILPTGHCSPGVLLRQWARKLPGANQEFLDDFWQETFPAEAKGVSSEPWTTFNRCIELRKQVLDAHTERMRSEGWLKPPPVRSP